MSINWKCGGRTLGRKWISLSNFEAQYTKYPGVCLLVTRQVCLWVQVEEKRAFVLLRRNVCQISVGFLQTSAVITRNFLTTDSEFRIKILTRSWWIIKVSFVHRMPLFSMNHHIRKFNYCYGWENIKYSTLTKCSYYLKLRCSVCNNV
jgi:hypothetical protein